MTTTTNYFSDCTTIGEAKKRYHDLLKRYHPDHGGDTSTCQTIIHQFQELAQRLVYGAYHAYQSQHGYQTDSDRADRTSFVFADVLAKIVDFNIDIEIIGFWIYAFNAYEYREQLKAIGFWFSKKHKAWIFSGGKKKRIRTRYTTNDVRYMHGSERVRAREEQ